MALGFQGRAASSKVAIDPSLGFHNPMTLDSHTSNIPSFHGPKDPYCESPQNSKFQVKLEGSQCRFQTEKNQEFQGSRAPGLQVSKVAGFQGSKVTWLYCKAPRIQACRFPWFQSFKISEFCRFGVPDRNPSRELLHDCLAGIPFRKSCRKLSEHLGKTCGSSLSFVWLVCIFLGFMCGAVSCVIESWNHKALKHLEQ